MTYKSKFRLIVITLPSLLNGIIMVTYYTQFIKEDSGKMLIIILLQAILTPIILNIILTSKVKLFSKESIPSSKDIQPFEEFLSKLGSSPLITLIIFLLLTIINIAIQAIILKTFFGIHSNYIVLYSGLVFSSLMLSAGFSYILLDNHIVHFLSEQDLFQYSDNLLLERQKTKHKIIPLFMTLMSLIFSASLTFLQILKLNNSELNNIAAVEQILIASMPYFIVFICIAVPLVLNWSKNSALLYRIINDRLAEMVSSEKDLTKRINISSIDEMATVSYRINRFSDIICDHLLETGEMFNNLKNYQNELFENVTSSSSSVAEIGENIVNLTKLIEHEYESVKTALGTGQSLAENLSSIVSLVNEQSDSVSESSAAVEEMIASISEVSNRTANVKEKTREITGVFKTGKEKIDLTVSSVSNVVEFSKSLIELNTLISGIAAQTNLLAMNAAIEAAHAGEAGKGFSVVSDEIRKLAENTAKHTKTSSENLKKILTEIDISLSVAEETGKIFTNMNEGIELVDNETLSISNSMVEHDKANKLVLEQLMNTKQVTINLNNLAATISEQEKSMSGSLIELEKNSSKSFQNCQEISTKNTAVNHKVNELIAITEKTGDISNKTMELVKSFKVE